MKSQSLCDPSSTERDLLRLRRLAHVSLMKASKGQVLPLGQSNPMHWVGDAAWVENGGQRRGEGLGGAGGQQIGHDLATCAWSNPL